MPSHKTLITTGVVGAIIAAICCATPVLVVLFGLFGISAWLALADYVVIAVLIVCLGLVALGLYLRRSSEQACLDGGLSEKGQKP